MPFRGEHACRLVDPDSCKKNSFRRVNNDREHEGKPYHVVYATKKGDDSQVEQSYRYPTKSWNESEAREHCRDHNGLLFEPAAEQGGALEMPGTETSQPGREALKRNVHNALHESWAITQNGMDSIFSMARRAEEDPSGVQGIMTESGARPQGTSLTEVRGDVAVISMIGPIFHYSNILTRVFGLPSTEQMAQEYRQALESPEINKVILWVDSPGGQLGGLSEFAQQISKGASKKKTVAYVGDLGASAAYWLASAASEIVAADTAELGSIGVVMALGRPAEDDDIVEVVSSQSPRKRPDPNTQAGLDQLQSRVDAITEVFISAVAGNRNLSRDQVTALGGDVAIASTAINMGLADRLGSLEGLIEELQSQNGGGNGMNITANGIKQENPEVAQELLDEGKQSAAQEEQTRTLNMIEAVLGAEAKDSVKQALDAGMTAEQLKAAQTIFQAQSQGSGGGSGQGGDSRQRILSEVEKAHGSEGVNDGSGQGGTPPKGPAQDAKERAEKAKS